MAVDHKQRTSAVLGAAWRAVLDADLSRVSWGAILAGAICALGLQALFTLLTIGLGLELISGGSASGAGWGSGLFFAVTSILSLFAGGWIAGRLSGMPLAPSAMLHGVVVWSVATIVAIWLGISATSAAISTATQAVSTVGSAAATVAGNAAQTVGNVAQRLGNIAETLLPEIESLQVDDLQSLIPASIQQDVQQILQNRNLTPEQISQEVQAITDRVIDQSDIQQAREILVAAGRRMLRNPGQADEIFQNALDRLTQPNGPLGEQQFDELGNVLQQRYGVSAEQATQFVERWRNQFVGAREAAIQAYRQTYNAVAEEVNQAIEAAEDAAQAAAEAVASAAWWSAFGLILALAAAAGGAAAGRPRDVATAETPLEH
jgi:hypothetical protein